ncbi:MAG TPA: LON peptidase substrate-binding domain-containing protein [Gammaproteobacteria bacterium]
MTRAPPAMTPDEIPLFPLKTVLFPGGVLPLRIFEPRYLDMIGRCMKHRQNFGVLLIVEGSEVGPARTADVGTLAEIVDWHQESDGLLGVTVAGRERFALKHTSLRDDRLYVGTVSVLEAEPRHALPIEYLYLAKLLKQVLPRIGGSYRHLNEDYEDATWVGYRLAEVLPLSLEDRQACLEMEDPLARLEKLSGTFN